MKHLQQGELLMLSSKEGKNIFKEKINAKTNKVIRMLLKK